MPEYERLTAANTHFFPSFLFLSFLLFFSFFNFLFHLRFDALFCSKEGFRRPGDYQLKELPRREKLCTVRCGPAHASWCILERERPQGGTRVDGAKAGSRLSPAMIYGSIAFRLSDHNHPPLSYSPLASFLLS